MNYTKLLSSFYFNTLIVLFLNFTDTIFAVPIIVNESRIEAPFNFKKIKKEKSSSIIIYQVTNQDL